MNFEGDFAPPGSGLHHSTFIHSALDLLFSSSPRAMRLRGEILCLLCLFVAARPKVCPQNPWTDRIVCPTLITAAAGGLAAVACLRVFPVCSVRPPSSLGSERDGGNSPRTANHRKMANSDKLMEVGLGKQALKFRHRGAHRRERAVATDQVHRHGQTGEPFRRTRAGAVGGGRPRTATGMQARRAGLGPVSRARSLALSNDEVEYVRKIISGHMRIHWLVSEDQEPSPRAIYRFFRDFGDAGVDICLLSLADLWATYSHTLTADQWVKELKICRILLEAKWEKETALVNPPILVNGDDLIREFKLQPGPIIGKILQAIREAQVEGWVTDKPSALAFAREWIENSSPHQKED